MDVTEATFERDVVERSRNVPVVVDFWAEWCGPCRALGPVLEKEVGARDGTVELAKVDVDSNQGLAATFGIRGIPAVKAFRDGRVVDEFVGALGAAAVSSFLDKLLAPPRIDRALEELRVSGELPAIRIALEQEDSDRALELILAAIPGSEPEERERLRELALAIFEDLGLEDPITVAYRRKLASALY